MERIKTIIIELIYYSGELPKVNYLDYISGKSGHDYTCLTSTFSEVKGITIQQFIIINKKVKELLLLPLIDIYYLLQYSSVAHLSSQFKKIPKLSTVYGLRECIFTALFVMVDTVPYTF